MSAPAAYDKFTGKHTTLDIKMPALEELEGGIYIETVSIEDGSHSFLHIHTILLTSPRRLWLLK
jgi:hypothetical protein